jgi:hypothetical protein
VSTLLVRWLLASYYYLPASTSLSQISTESKYVLIKERLIELIPFVTVSSFEAYWLYILGGLVTLWLYRERTAFSVYLVALAVSIGISFLVYDMTRSIVSAFSALFIGVRIMARERRKYYVPKNNFLRSAVFGSVPYLTHYIWPVFIGLLKFNS